VYILGLRFSAHFKEDRRDAADRRGITLEMCALVKAEPLDEDRQ
jgi:hypothetical protein